METKKELTVADFINLSTIYRTVDYNIGMLSDSIVGEYADDIKQDLQDIYDLVSSAVISKKDGTQPKQWDIPISDCDILLSYQTIRKIAEIIEVFKEKGRQRFYLYDDTENTIVENLSDVNIEFAVENLLIGLVEL